MTEEGPAVDLHDIEYFVTLIEERSFSKAAARLIIAQPSLSNFLKRLEKKMDVPLVVRGSHTVTPTKYGLLYYEAGKEILERRDRLYQEMRMLKESMVDTITCGSNSERSIRYISHIMPLFKAKYPSVDIIIRENTEPVLIKDVQSNKLDFCIVPTYRDYPEIRRIPITNDEVFLALSREHPLYEKAVPAGTAEPPRMSIEQFQDAAFILLREKTLFRLITDRYFEKASFSPNITMETQTIRTSLLMLSGGIGTVTFGPRGYDNSFTDLRYVALEDPPYYSVSICCREGVEFRQPQQDFIRLIHEHLAEY